MPATTMQIENGTLTLPPSLRKSWKGVAVYLRSEGDTIVIKKLTPPAMSLKTMVSEMRQAARKAKLSTREVASVIKEVQGELYR